MTYINRIQVISEEDVRCLRMKDAEYGGSWLKRGGVGAYMMAARKIDRLEVQVEKHGYDVLAAATADDRQEGILDDIRDLRRYLMLIEAEILERATSFPLQFSSSSDRLPAESFSPPGPIRRVPRSADEPRGFDPAVDCVNLLG